MKIAELMQAKIVDVTRTTMTLEFADTAERTETLISLLQPYGIQEIVRTGIDRHRKRRRIHPYGKK